MCPEQGLKEKFLQAQVASSPSVDLQQMAGLCLPRLEFGYGQALGWIHTVLRALFNLHYSVVLEIKEV